MDFSIHQVYVLKLAPDEFRVVSKALRGAGLTDEEHALAVHLQEEMLYARAKAAKHLAESFDKDIASIEREKKP